MAGSFKLGALVNYDILTVGGEQYSANQLLDKNIVAKTDVMLYPSLFKDDGKFLVKKGQSIGKAFSYLTPTSKNNPTGRVVLQFERSVNGTYQYFWLKDDKAVSTSALASQGTKTVDQEVQEEKDKAEKENDPIVYYAKKIGLPVLMWGAGIYVGVVVIKELFQVGKESLRKKAGLTGVKRKRKNKK